MGRRGGDLGPFSIEPGHKKQPAACIDGKLFARYQATEAIVLLCAGSTRMATNLEVGVKLSLP